MTELLVPSEVPSRQIHLRAGSQLLLENKKNEHVTLKLLSGQSEIFGCPLPLNHPQDCSPGHPLAIDALTPSTLEITGSPDLEILQKSSTLEYKQISSKISQMRINAITKSTRGPIVMLVGPKSSGKSTLSRILTNWAVTDGQAALYVDLDPGSANTMMPATIGAFPVIKHLKIDECYNEQVRELLHYGFKTPGDNPRLYKFIIDELATSCFRLMDKLIALKFCGMIIDTCGLQEDSDYDILMHISQAFNANVIIVLDEVKENLYEKILQDVSEGVEVFYLPKSPAVKSDNDRMRMRNYQERLDEYFHGTLVIPRVSNCVTVGFDKVRIHQMRMRIDRREVKFIDVKPGVHLVGRVMSVGSWFTYHCHGSVYVTHVDVEKEKITMVTTWDHFGRDNCFYLTDITYTDDNFSTNEQIR